MQINRMFEIIYLLLDKEKVSAKELSERFEVSTRTIYRDVERLSAAGIPIYMTKGRNGGIRLLPDYILNKTLLTDAEKSSILSALHSLNALDEESVQNTLSKLGMFFGQNNTGFIEIDYNDWGNLIKEQFEKSKQAILLRRILSFDYVSAKNEATKRKVEPYVLWFKDKTWYLKCFCLDRQNPRIFRLSRMRNVTITDQTYVPRNMIFEEEAQENQYVPSAAKIVMKVGKEQRYRVLGEFFEKDVVENEDGSFTVTMNLTEDEWVYGYILSFGSSAVVLEPEHTKKIIKERLRKNLENYL